MAISKHRQKREIQRQVAQIQRRSRQVVREKVPLMIARALTGVGIVVANKAQERSPVEYSILINSQYRRIDAYPARYTVSIGYTADYAAALHNRKDWSPRPPDQKSGPAWNPNAQPGWLTWAGDTTRTTQTRIMLGDLKL